jgi:hypothetical protein
MLMGLRKFSSLSDPRLGQSAGLDADGTLDIHMLEKRWSSISSKRKSNCLHVLTLADPLIMQSWAP